jgi:hypothetical protein
VAHSSRMGWANKSLISMDARLSPEFLSGVRQHRSKEIQSACAYIRRKSEPSLRLTANNQQPTKPGCEDANNDGGRRAIGHDARNGGDHDDDQPDCYHAEFAHGSKDSTTKALPHVVTAVIAKRAEIASQIENLQGQVKRLTVDLDHVEETLRLFALEIDMDAIAPRRVPAMHHAFRGETSRIVLESLRKATGPLSTTQLTERVMRERNLDLNDAKLRRTMGQRDGAYLGHWKRERGVIRSMPGPGQVLLWELVT